MSDIELDQQKEQGNQYLMAIHELIAEKSFHYTHIIRVAPQKGVVTCARNAIIKLNHKITFYWKVYGQCCATLLCLAADAITLETFKILTKDDVKASSAVKDLNAPGSSSLSLS